jgi:hypothetical protein
MPSWQRRPLLAIPELSTHRGLAEHLERNARWRPDLLDRLFLESPFDETKAMTPLVLDQMTEPLTIGHGTGRRRLEGQPSASTEIQ